MNLAKQWDTKSISRNQRHFCIPTTLQKQKSGKKSNCYSNKKNKVLRNKPNQGSKRPVLRKPHNNEERNQGRHKQVETYTVFMDRKN